MIVGARIAGSLTATLLGEKQWRVLVLERNTFPSDTLSTHFFRAPALLAFKRAGVFEEVLATGAQPLVNSFKDVDGHVFHEPVAGGDGLNYFLCVRRITLDEILARRAKREATVQFREAATVRELIQQNGRVIGVRFAQGSSSDEVTARVVVGADGFRSMVAKTVSPRAEHTEPVRRAMYYGYFAGLQPADGPAAEFHYRGNELVYVFPCDEDLTLLAVSVPISEFPEWKRDGRRLFLERLRARPQLLPRLQRAEWIGKLYGAGDIPGYMRVPYGPGWILVGDSGLIMDPFTGQGIDQGSTHAVYLAGALHRWMTGEVPWETAMTEYHRCRNAFTEQVYMRTCTNARDFRPLTQAALAQRRLASPH